MRSLQIFSLFLLLIFTSCEDEPKEPSQANLWLTTLDQKSLLEKRSLEVVPVEDITSEDAITIDSTLTFQEIDGFGYTLTGGSALHIHTMSDGPRKALLQELFGTGANEIGVSYLRLSIGASDLNEVPFSYNDMPKGETDVDLENFSLANDTVHVLPVLKEILQLAPDIKIMGSPWSPPAWMKDNKDTRGGSLLKEFYPVYAKYLVKYVQTMAEHGIAIDAITVQNEPLHPGNNPSLLMIAEDQADFIKNHLGPEFKKNNLDTKIIIYDHNADRPDYPISILNDPKAAQYIDGSAFHLYGGKIEALSIVHEAHPDKNLYFTEQWVGAPGNFAQEMTWHTENLIIGATRNWSRNVLEWNLAADENQDPHTDRGGCDRCLGAITIKGDKVTREPAYYIIAQASKFVRPGSVRIESNMPENLPNVAFLTPEGKIVLIVQNKAEIEKTVTVKFGKNQTSSHLPAGSVGTIVI